MEILANTEKFNDYLLGIDTILTNKEDGLSLEMDDRITVKETVYDKPTGRTLTLKVVEVRSTTNDVIYRVRCIGERYENETNKV